MNDYLDRAREHAEMLPAEPIIPRASDLAHVSAVQAFATLAVAEALAALALPQGTEHITGETTGIGAPSPSPAHLRPIGPTFALLDESMLITVRDAPGGRLMVQIGDLTDPPLYLSTTTAGAERLRDALVIAVGAGAPF